MDILQINTYASLVIKIALMILLVLYTLFGFIIIRQVSDLHKSLPSKTGSILKGLAMIHFGLSLALTVLALGLL